MQKITDLQELLKHELKDLYSAEVQLLSALPKMAGKATNHELKKAFTDHLSITEKHRERLDKVQAFFNMEKVKETKGFFANLFKSKEGEEHCKAMEGLIKEAESLMGEDMAPEVMDAALIAAAQKVEHYEISSYGTARAYATQLGFKKVYDILTDTLNEEYAADDSLTKLAVGKINLSAEEGDNNAGTAEATKDKKETKKDTQIKADKVSQKKDETDSAKTKPVTSTPKKMSKPETKNKLVKNVAKATPPKKAAKKTAVKRTSTKQK